MKKITSIVFILTIISSCTPKDKYFYLPDILKTSLRKGDTLVYKSSLGKLARYTVHDVVNGNIRYGAFDPPFAYYECQITYIDTVNNKETENIYHYPQNFSVPNIGATHLYHNSHFISIAISAIDCSQCVHNNWYNKGTCVAVFNPIYTILKREFSDVFYCNTNPTLFNSQPNVETYYCNLRQGLLGFKYTDGEIYELVN